MIRVAIGVVPRVRHEAAPRGILNELAAHVANAWLKGVAYLGRSREGPPPQGFSSFVVVA
jgi:hypothetical protein